MLQKLTKVSSMITSQAMKQYDVEPAIKLFDMIWNNVRHGYYITR